MKRKPLTHAARLLCALALSMSLAPAALAADPSEPTQPSPCYPTAVTRSEDGTEIRKMYDLGPEDDPGGIPRSDFEQDGYHYTLTDLLKQELPANESRQHTETVSVNSKSKDMGAVLALLPQTKEFITEDGLSGVLTLKLDTVKVEVAGYGSSTKTVTATRTYPGLANQDTQYIPKTIQDGGNSMTLQAVDWQTEGDGHFTAMASYSGSATSSYVKGYTVTADYAGTVSRINLNKIRYVAIFEGTAPDPAPGEAPGDSSDPNTPADTQEATGVLTDIRTAVIDGNSRYYLRLQGESVYYVLSAADAPQVVTLNTGDRVTITYRPQEDASILEATAVTLVSGSSGTGTVDNPTDPIKINPAPGIGDIITDPGDGGRVELPVEPPPEEVRQ